MFEIAGMDTRDFNNKCGGSVFKINGDIFSCSGIRHGDDEDDEDWEPSSGEERLCGMVLASRRRGTVWEDKDYSLDDLEGAAIDLAFPAIGYVNYKKGAVYVQRNVGRQWKLGWNSRTVSLLDRFSVERREASVSITLGHLSSTAEFIKRVFSRFYYSPERAIALVKNGERIGAAISPYIYIGQSVNFPNILICYKNIPIGYIKDNGRKVIFPEAEYISKLLPFPVTIEEHS